MWKSDISKGKEMNSYIVGKNKKKEGLVPAIALSPK